MKLFLLQANLKMDRRSNCEQREAMVMKLLRDMGLIDAQNTLIGVPGSDKSLSGGERKRLAFASEVSYLSFLISPSEH